MHAHLLFIKSCNDNTVIGTFWSFLEEEEKGVGKKVLCEGTQLWNDAVAQYGGLLASKARL